MSVFPCLSGGCAAALVQAFMAWTQRPVEIFWVTVTLAPTFMRMNTMRVASDPRSKDVTATLACGSCAK